MSLAEELKKGNLDKEDQDIKNAKNLTNKAKRNGAESMSTTASITTPPPKKNKETTVHLGGYIRQDVHDAIMEDVAASKGKWNKTKLVEYILAKHYDIRLY